MEISYKDKKVVVTGGASGIGKQIVKTYLENGATVIFCDICNIDEAMLEYREYGSNIHSFCCDISKSCDIEALTSYLKGFGKIDVFINNAGVMPRMTTLDCDEETIDKIFAVNVRSILLLGKHMPEIMNENGVILNAASIAAVIPTVTSAVYAASKAAVITISRCMAAELAPYGIRVLSYAPGFVSTKRNIDKGNLERKVSEIALRRPAELKEIANVLLMLSSEYASYMSGSNIEITGGKFCVQNPDIAWQKKENSDV